MAIYKTGAGKVERLAYYSLATIFNSIKGKSKRINVVVNGEYFQVRIKSRRLMLFMHKGSNCVLCGVEGVYFALERHVHKNGCQDNPHFNLYGCTKDGREILMTKDHILPRAQGGSNKLKNLQTMCTRCNGKKGNTYAKYKQGEKQ